jgi:hypothetical protein
MQIIYSVNLSNIIMITMIELPVEILTKIFQNVPSETNLNTVCKKFNAVANIKGVYTKRNPCICAEWTAYMYGIINCKSIKHKCVCYSAQHVVMKKCKYDGNHNCVCKNIYPSAIEECRYKGEHPCMCWTEFPSVMKACRFEGEHPCKCNSNNGNIISECRANEHPCKCYTGNPIIISVCKAQNHLI